MTADEAAALVARAIVERKRLISPWWFYPSEAAILALRRPIGGALSFWFKQTDDTPSARLSRAEPDSAETADDR